jgi:3-oxoacyl-[acyl-carrier-protein] synthase II
MRSSTVSINPIPAAIERFSPGLPPRSFSIDVPPFVLAHAPSYNGPSLSIPAAFFEVFMRRVVITGLGAVSPHGIGTNAFWNGLLDAKSSITPITAFDPATFPCRVAGQMAPFKTTDYVPKSYRKATKIMARDIELAVVAADLAIKDAKLLTKGVAGSLPPEQTQGWYKPDPTRIGCNIGAGLICADLNELSQAMTQARGENHQLSLAKWGRSDDPAKTSGMENLTPLWLLKYLPNMLACHVSIIHDMQGPSNTLTCGQASAGLALSEAVHTIERGHADMALVGGCETKLHTMGLMRWCLLHRLNTTSNDTPATACKPYDVSANGGVLAEGGAVLVIEEYEHAKARGATIYAEVAGFGASSNAAVSVVDADPTGEPAGVAIRKALKQAKISPGDVDLIIPPGYGIPSWDKSDAAALRFAFGSSLAKTAITASRAGIGDCGAGAQALDLVAAILALHSQTLPPTANTTTPIDNLPIVLQKQSQPLTHALVLSTSLGGQNSAVLLKKAS